MAASLPLNVSSTEWDELASGGLEGLLSRLCAGSLPEDLVAIDRQLGFPRLFGHLQQQARERYRQGTLTRELRQKLRLAHDEIRKARGPPRGPEQRKPPSDKMVQRLWEKLPGVEGLPRKVWRVVQVGDEQLVLCRRSGRGHPAAWNVDHIFPWSLGGEDAEPNLQLLPEALNCMAKRDRPLDLEVDAEELLRKAKGRVLCLRDLMQAAESFWHKGIEPGLRELLEATAGGSAVVLRADSSLQRERGKDFSALEDRNLRMAVLIQRCTSGKDQQVIDWRAVWHRFDNSHPGKRTEAQLKSRWKRLKRGKAEAGLEELQPNKAGSEASQSEVASLSAESDSGASESEAGPSGVLSRRPTVRYTVDENRRAVELLVRMGLLKDAGSMRGELKTLPAWIKHTALLLNLDVMDLDRIKGACRSMMGMALELVLGESRLADTRRKGMDGARWWQVAQQLPVLGDLFFGKQRLQDNLHRIKEGLRSGAAFVSEAEESSSDELSEEEGASSAGSRGRGRGKKAAAGKRRRRQQQQQEARARRPRVGSEAAVELVDLTQTDSEDEIEVIDLT